VTTSVECVTSGRHQLGESPLWSRRESALYFVDLRGRTLNRYAPVCGSETQWQLDALPGGVVAAPDGSLILAMSSGIVRFDTGAGTSSPLVAPERAALGNRLNDTKCDRLGRLWTGSMRDYGKATTGSLYCIDAELDVKRMLADLTIPNALSWSPDDRTLYFADTADGRIRAYDFDLDSGRLGAMRVLVDAGILSGRPDGATVDADGCVWNARYGGGCVARITPDGKVDRVVDVPCSQVTSCAFGGNDLRTLYVTTATQRLSDDQLRREPLAGAVFAVRLEVGGFVEPDCAL
jgi:sugar lactone lactonase YvrE